ncbi:MAG TPA: TonB-dependent receptor, partial [Vicinamibacterales bacterium]
MLRRAALLISALFLAVLLPVFAFAQPTARPAASVRGTVTDATGGVIAGAAIRLEPASGGAARTTATGGDGRFAFEEVAGGTYLLTVTATGLATHVGAVDVIDRQSSAADVVLAPAGVREEVLVTATRVATPASSIPNTVTIVGRDAIERRTAASGDLASLLESNVPGFAPSLKKMSGRGETLRGRNPLYSINGVPQHAPLRDGERDGHTIDLDFVERIEVIHGANAIQGIGATGGVVNMVTKSPKRDGSWTHDVKLSFGNGDRLDSRGWSNKASYLTGKRQGRFEFMAGLAVEKRGLFFDAEGNAVGLYPTQGDIMDSSSRGLYAKAGVDLGTGRRFEVSASRYRLTRDGDYVAVPGNRAAGVLSGTRAGDPRGVSGDPARNDATTVTAEYRDRGIGGGDASVQVYGADSRALFEGGAFATFALTIGGPAFLDQSLITSRKYGAKLTWTLTDHRPLGITPTVGLDLAQDRSEQALARSGRTWVPPTTFREAAPFVQVQRLAWNRVLLSAGARFEFATVAVNDFATLPSSRSTVVSGGRPSFTDILPNIGAVVPVNDRLSFYSSFAEGFTMPDVGRVLRAINTPGQDVDALLDIRPVVASNIEVG